MVRGTIWGAVVWTFASSATAQTKVTIEDLPQFEYVRSINNNGLVVGEANGRAVVAKPGEPTTVVDAGLGNYPFPRAINDRGQVVGQYSLPDLQGSRAFLYDPDWGIIDLSVADARSASSTINDLGQAFWVTTSPSGQLHMNVRDELGNTISIDTPLATVFDANNRGQALSDVPLGGGAVTTFSAGTLSQIEIDDPTFTTRLYDINNVGQAVGRFYPPNRAAIWDENNGLRQLIEPGEADGFDHIASAINDHGLVALTLIPDSGSGF